MRQHGSYYPQDDGDARDNQGVGGINIFLGGKYDFKNLSKRLWQEIVEEIDEDGSGELEFPEFIQLAAKFLIEEDEEQMKWELREAFRIYDKQGNSPWLKAKKVGGSWPSFTDLFLGYI